MYVPNRSRQTLEAKIQRYVRPGSEIWTDCWSGYTGLSALGNVHRTVNHSNNFVDPLSGVCTNQVEGYWSRLKQFLRRLGPCSPVSCRNISTSLCGGKYMAQLQPHGSIIYWIK
nr:unnamed protein product [Callosobruchus analis]